MVLPQGSKHCGIEQVVARESHNLKVAGSSPATAPIPKFAWVRDFLAENSLKDALSRSVDKYGSARPEDY